MSIIIGGDIVPTESNQHLFFRGEVQALCGSGIMGILKNADYRIFNLETPLSAEHDPINKCGPCLVAEPESVEMLKALQVDLLTLANNHIMDQGEKGLLSTTNTLTMSSISYVGVGKDVKSAAQPFFFSIKRKRYGVYACAEHEFSIAEDNRSGANPFDPVESLDHITKAKEKCDYLIVLYHGGKEHYRYPSPYLQKISRKMIEKGANLIVCQHSHCIGCMEKYNDGTIVYGQGNFLFDSQDNEYWSNSLLICVNDTQQIDFFPIEKDGNRIRLATGTKKDQIMKDFFTRSEEIEKPDFVEKKYCSFANDNYDNYIMHLSGKEGHLAFRMINKLSKQRLKKCLIKRYTNQFGTVVQNFIECEAHRELLLQGIKNQIKNI